MGVPPMVDGHPYMAEGRQERSEQKDGTKLVGSEPKLIRNEFLISRMIMSLCSRCPPLQEAGLGLKKKQQKKPTISANLIIAGI